MNDMQRLNYSPTTVQTSSPYDEKTDATDFARSAFAAPEERRRRLSVKPITANASSGTPMRAGLFQDMVVQSGSHRYSKIDKSHQKSMLNTDYPWKFLSTKRPKEPRTAKLLSSSKHSLMNTDYDYLFKVLCIGDSAVGKSSIVTRCMFFSFFKTQLCVFC